MLEDYNVGYLGDERLKKTAPYYLNVCTNTKQSVYVDLPVTVQPKFGRWLRNKKVEVLELIEQTIQKITPLTQGLHVLAIQDTTELKSSARKAVQWSGNGRQRNRSGHISASHVDIKC